MIGTDGKCSICGMVMSPEGLTFHSCGGVPILVPPRPPPDGPGSHAWDLREMQAQRERADRAEVREKALREQVRITDELLADARRLLDALAKKTGVTLLDERAALAAQEPSK